MTTAQYLNALRKLGLTPHGIETAKLLHCSMRTIARYASGAEIPPLVADKLRSEIEVRS